MATPSHTGPNPFLARFRDHPSLVSPESAAQIEASAQGLLATARGIDMLVEHKAADDSFWPSDGDWRAAYRPYNVQAGILTIPISGMMLNDFSFAVPGLATGYQYIDKAFSRGMGDPEVKGIALIINTGGGDASGNFDLVDRMTAAKEAAGKPVWAVTEFAYSAGYSIASVADVISTTRTGGVGSIGVVTGHMDSSEAMKQRGLKFTHISAPAGGDKTAGSPFEPLSDDAKGRMQARVDEIYSHFASIVARNRGMTEQAVIDTKARTFTASQALSNGLADKVMSPDDAMAAFLADLSSNGDEHMSTPKDGTVEQAAHDLAVAAARDEGKTAGHAAGKAATKPAIDPRDDFRGALSLARSIGMPGLRPV